jgi:DNA-binding transcriptional LysR family regulator
MDKLRAISVFRRVIELGSFKAAAEDLGLSKAAISKNINELEDYLQSPLINRTTRKMHITENGQLYYNHVRSILDDLSSADLSIIESSHRLSGLLRISVPMSVGIAVINSAICDFKKSYPKITIELKMSDQYIDLVEQGIDVAIRGGGELKNSNLKSRKLESVSRVLCASPGYLKNAPALTTPENLAAHSCLLYSLSASPTNWLFRCDDEVKIIDVDSTASNSDTNSNSSSGGYTVDNGIALKQAAIADLGIMLIPELLVSAELASGELIHLLPEWKPDNHALYAVYPYHRETSPKVRTFIDFLSNFFSTE